MLKIFSVEYLDSLVEEAAQSPRIRQHRNIHEGFGESCQRLLNAIGTNSYIRPHRHSLDPKAETLIAVRGKFALVSFDDAGSVVDVVLFGTEKVDVALPVGVELAPGTWHTIIALVAGSILLELKAGPFNPDAAKEPAPWAPEEGTQAGNEYFQRLRRLI
ncbi:MAG: WbuC family cupin fold metalloprotein [Magnetococcales bacterium]|nr:WbuC family cupin fold metalloprotein [Magnetococcales bacterium]MBF0420365.1 WbuC family cupin fold metalloprotein [Magnetococcales bacterium]